MTARECRGGGRGSEKEAGSRQGPWGARTEQGVVGQAELRLGLAPGDLLQLLDRGAAARAERRLVLLLRVGLLRLAAEAPARRAVAERSRSGPQRQRPRPRSRRPQHDRGPATLR